MKDDTYRADTPVPDASKRDFSFLDTASELDVIRSEAITFIRERMTEANADGVVVAMSGGIDSTLTAGLAAEAVGSENVLGLNLPFKKTDSEQSKDAETLAEGFGIEFRKVSIRQVLDVFEDLVASQIHPNTSKYATGNVVARLRMLCVYYAANASNRIVLGTSNRSELLLGYFTKHGDGAADIYPIGDLYKTEVRSLADHVGLPRRILYKDPSADLWTGQSDLDDLGAPYDVIDPVLRSLVEQNHSIKVTSKRLEVDRKTVEDIAVRYFDTMHKREAIPTPSIADRSSTADNLPPNFIEERYR